MSLQDWESDGLKPLTDTVLWINAESETVHGDKVPKDMWGTDLSAYLPSVDLHTYYVGRTLAKDSAGNDTIRLDFNLRNWNGDFTAMLVQLDFYEPAPASNRIRSSMEITAELKNNGDDWWKIDDTRKIELIRTNVGGHIAIKFTLLPTGNNPLAKDPTVKFVAAYWCWPE